MHSYTLFSNDPILALLAYSFKELKLVRVVAGFRASGPGSNLCGEGEAVDGKDCCSFHLLGCRASFPGQGRGQRGSAGAVTAAFSCDPDNNASPEVLKRLQEEKERRECSKRQRRK